MTNNEEKEVLLTTERAESGDSLSPTWLSAEEEDSIRITVELGGRREVMSV